MKTVRYYGIEDVRYEDTPMPDISADDVLIQVLFAGICGSDMHIYRKGMFVQNIPETMGHEFVGRVCRVGADVSSFSEGQIVTANPMVPCMKCASCREGNYNTCDELGFIGEVRQGCFAEYIAMPEKDVIAIPCPVDSEPADIKKFVLTEPLGVALNVCHRVSCKKTDKVAIIGAGQIDLLCLAVLKQVEKVCHVTMVDLSEARLEYARAAGADDCVPNSDDLGYDFDVIIECAGVKPSVEAAVSHVKSNGKIGIVSVFENAVEIDCSEIVNRQLRIIGANVYHREDLECAAKLLKEESYTFEKILTHTFTTEECKSAFSMLNSGDKRAEKVVFSMV